MGQTALYKLFMHFTEGQQSYQDELWKGRTVIVHNETNIQYTRSSYML